MKRNPATDNFDLATDRVASCSGKASFGSYHEADRVANHRRRKAKSPLQNHKQGKSDRAGLHPYRCRFCHRWHIGSSKK